jgi:hypothetical protein
MAFVGIGGGSKILKAKSLIGREGFIIEGYYTGTQTTKYDNESVLMTLTNSFSLEQEMGQDENIRIVEDHFKPGDRVSITGGGMLLKRAQMCKEGTLCQFIYQGFNKMEGNVKYKGKCAHSWEVLNDPTQTIPPRIVPPPPAHKNNIGDTLEDDDDEDDV